MTETRHRTTTTKAEPLHDCRRTACTFDNWHIKTLLSYNAREKIDSKPFKVIKSSTTTMKDGRFIYLYIIYIIIYNDHIHPYTTQHRLCAHVESTQCGKSAENNARLPEALNGFRSCLIRFPPHLEQAISTVHDLCGKVEILPIPSEKQNRQTIITFI